MQYSFELRACAILIASSTVFVGACSLRDSAASDESLLSIPVLSSENIDISGLNKRINNQSESDLFAVLSMISGPISEQGAVVVRSNRKGSEKEYSVVLINDNIPDDDSVSGYRYHIVLKRNISDKWIVVEMKQSWRCWEDRGHTQFSAEPCV
ncbi:hypothetical protein [Hahella chejuensis]|uniref:hypothetical protein n=1 Tax=Hahella chejuensis TaxID=158327 RepID=UPI0005A23124|nr:hypothetical protein [Hahella chejuensis]